MAVLSTISSILAISAISPARLARSRFTASVRHGRTERLYVGGVYSGAGTLSITNGGIVSTTGATYVGRDPNSAATINFGENGGTLTTQTFYASPTQLTGTGQSMPRSGKRR